MRIFIDFAAHFVKKGIYQHSKKNFRHSSTKESLDEDVAKDHLLERVFTAMNEWLSPIRIQIYQ